MRCKKIRDLISPYLDDMTDEKEKLMVEEHLAVCSACLLFANDIRLIRQVMMKLDSPPLPPGFAEGVRERLEKERPPDKPRPGVRNQVRALLPGGAGGRLKGELIRFYRWRRKTLE